MVLDPRGEVDAAEGELEDCEKKNQELNSPNQTNGEMESLTSTNSSEDNSRSDQSESEERTFITNLYCFMKERNTPIERIPHLGFKQINLWKIYKAVETLGGYDAVTARRQWKNVYDELGGSPGSTSAATCTRRHYERLVLPFERQLRGEEDKPLPPSKPRKQYKRSPENRGSKPESKKKRKMERDESEEKMLSDHHCDRGRCSHHSPWLISSDRLDSEHTSTAPVLGMSSRENPLLQTSSPPEVISPLEKKKRLAQASLTIPASEDGGELERPSVIHISHSSQSNTRGRHSSDGSPVPVSSPSGSLSRSPSPYSVSSEDCIAVTTQKSPAKEPENKTATRLPALSTSKAVSTGVCKPLSCYPNTKELANYPRLHYREFLQAGATEKTQRSLLAWTSDDKSRLASHRLPLPAYTKPYWVPHASSFSKVLPRDPCRPMSSLQPSFKPHMSSYHQHLLKRPDEAYLKKMPVSSPIRITDRKEKAKTALPKPLPTQQYLFHPHGGLTVPYQPALERLRGDLTVEQLKALPLQPVLFPTHLSIPPAQSHSMHCPPVGTHFPGSYEAALPSYNYPMPIWHAPAGYNMPSLQPY
ncbi:AT-rich interactive domain-containing protein 5A [Danio rerio]|uniref:AT-rich interactive domain 5A (MRF1-like) n=2 Tax=Danio rerio TaxID=7955 RepID=F1QHS9_DANRE|nr:AT-rich interactive domain-containing protein 5A [Danio rerio]|eukprot:NP_001314703.1 AT-rich interactive domain-containing protein 5A [Danio rerio]